jgi:hypothetical protein
MGVELSRGRSPQGITPQAFRAPLLVILQRSANMVSLQEDDMGITHIELRLANDG